MYSLILIFLFLGAYLVADSPFNLVTKLSSGAAGGWDALYGIVLYAALAIPLFIYADRMREKKLAIKYRSGKVYIVIEKIDIILST